MRELLLDTSALLYWTLLPERLSEPAVRAIENAEERLISVVSLWEVALKQKKGALELPLPVTEFTSRVRRAEGTTIVPLELETAVDGALLDWSHRDPADRWLVALATRRNCSLVSSDERIRRYYALSVW